MWLLENWQSPTQLMLYFYWSSLFYANDDGMFVLRVSTYPFQWNGLGEAKERPSGPFLTLKPVKQDQMAIFYYLTLKRPTQVVFWYLHEGLRFPPWEQRAVETSGWAQSWLLQAVRTQPSMPWASASRLWGAGDPTGWCLHPATPEQVSCELVQRLRSGRLVFLVTLPYPFPQTDL